MLSWNLYSPAQFEYRVFAFIFGFHVLKFILGKVDLYVTSFTSIS